MDKKAFLERLNEKIKSAKKIQAEPEKTFYEVKNKLIEIIQQDFLDSVPDEIVEGKEIKLDSRMIEVEIISDKEYQLNIAGEIIQKYKCNSNSTTEATALLYKLEEEIVTELSNLIGKKVFSSHNIEWLIFYCFY